MKYINKVTGEIFTSWNNSADILRGLYAYEMYISSLFDAFNKA